MVHRREVDGQIFTFGHQGATWENAMTAFDHLTGSVWSQPYGRPIAGELVDADITLELVPSTMTTWAEWEDLHPQTVAYQYEGDGAQWIEDEVLEESSIVADYFGEQVMYPVEELTSLGTITDKVGAGESVDVVVAVAEGGSAWNVFEASLDGEPLDLSVEGTTVVDETSGTVWDISHGYHIEGPMVGSLVVLPASTMFTEQFLDYYPEGRIWSP